MLYVWEFLNAFLFLYSEQTSLLFVILLFYPLRSLTCNGKVWTCDCFIVKVGSCMCVRIIVKKTVFFQCGSERDGDRIGCYFQIDLADDSDVFRCHYNFLPAISPRLPITPTQSQTHCLLSPHFYLIILRLFRAVCGFVLLQHLQTQDFPIY